MKLLRYFGGILAACLLFMLPSCTHADVPADTRMPAGIASETIFETILDPAPETAPEIVPPIEYDTTTPVRYTYIYNVDWKTEITSYLELCIGPAEEDSVPSIPRAYETSIYLSSPVIHAKVNQLIHIPFMVLSENPEFYATDFDVTWRIAEPELLAIVKVDEKRFMGGSVGDMPESGFEVYSLSPGVAHLYITITNPENGLYMTRQQVIVIEE